ILLLAAGCGGGSSGGGTSSAGGPVTLTMWYWGQQEANGLSTFVAQSVKAYEKEHPNVTIKTVLQSTDNLMPNFAAAAKAQKGPDIEYRWGGIWALQDAWDGNLAPVSDYIPKSELAHYLNASEDTYNGKVWTAPWYVQPSFPVLYRKDVLARAGISQPPTTWDEFLSDCSTLRAKGITPIAGGVKDGWFGGWLFSILGSQSLSSVDELKQAVVGDKKFTDPALAEWWTRLGQMIQANCWNDDIGSEDLYQAQQTWVDGKSAMTITAGTDVRKFVNEVGASNVGVMTMPAYAQGVGAGKLGSTSQTLGISSWSPHKQEAADFIRFMHTPAELKLFYKDTGALPADDRFDPSLITVPQVKQLFDYAQNGAPYLENFIPTDLDAKANFGEVQLMFAGKATAQQAAETTESDMARIRTIDPDLIDNFKQWAGEQ
ncbi:MAG TPA: extracellular solute-binding protein, partial [Gaiellales bacterium]|nr:extracellular solute-binding protein [Gaiellales bacterium]